MMSTKKQKKFFILSLGGSLIAPKKGIDIKFLQAFNKFIRKKVAQGCHFFIVAGGGDPARQYRDAAMAVCDRTITDDDTDWLGIHATRMNAHLMRTIFRDIAYEKIIKNYDLIDKKATHPVVIAAGWRPGWSTDYDAVLLAQDYHVKTVINLTNIDMVYDQDPNKHKNAKPIKKMSWDKMLTIVGTKFSSGMSAPFDPIASKLARSIGLRVVICYGKNLANLDKILEGKRFVGTELK